MAEDTDVFVACLAMQPASESDGTVPIGFRLRPLFYFVEFLGEVDERPLNLKAVRPLKRFEKLEPFEKLTRTHILLDDSALDDRVIRSAFLALELLIEIQRGTRTVVLPARQFDRMFGQEASR